MALHHVDARLVAPLATVQKRWSTRFQDAFPSSSLRGSSLTADSGGSDAGGRSRVKSWALRNKMDAPVSVCLSRGKATEARRGIVRAPLHPFDSVCPLYAPRIYACARIYARCKMLHVGSRTPVSPNLSDFPSSPHALMSRRIFFPIYLSPRAKRMRCVGKEGKRKEGRGEKCSSKVGRKGSRSLESALERGERRESRRVTSGELTRRKRNAWRKTDSSIGFEA